MCVMITRLDARPRLKIDIVGVMMRREAGRQRTEQNDESGGHR